jgi:hypothetical protein
VSSPVRLWIDDERPAPATFTHIASSSWAAVAVLAEFQSTGQDVALISFDHDLGWRPGTAGEDDTSRPVLEWIRAEGFWPQEIRVHSANLDGHEWLVAAAVEWAPASTVVDPTDPWA